MLQLAPLKPKIAGALKTQLSNVALHKHSVVRTTYGKLHAVAALYLKGHIIGRERIEATNKPLGKKKRLSYKMVASVLSSIDFLFAIFNVLPDTRSITVYYISKWVLVIFAIIPFFQKQAKIS